MDSQEKINSNLKQMEFALRNACSQHFGALDHGFLCQSIGTLDPNEPLCLPESATLNEVLATFKQFKIGCVMLTNQEKELVGIFSERDWILKIAGSGIRQSDPINKHMTLNPIAVNMDTSIAFALNLMSEGGFRHLPLIDEFNRPTGLISVKNLIDNMAQQCIKSLLDFELELDLS